MKSKKGFQFFLKGEKSFFESIFQGENHSLNQFFRAALRVLRRRLFCLRFLDLFLREVALRPRVVDERVDERRMRREWEPPRPKDGGGDKSLSLSLGLGLVASAATGPA
jgi:hypothetical protein